MDEPRDYDFTPTSGGKDLDQIWRELALKRVLMLDEVPFAPLWADLRARWDQRPPGTR